LLVCCFTVFLLDRGVINHGRDLGVPELLLMKTLVQWGEYPRAALKDLTGMSEKCGGSQNSLYIRSAGFQAKASPKAEAQEPALLHISVVLSLMRCLLHRGEVKDTRRLLQKPQRVPPLLKIFLYSLIYMLKIYY